MSDYSASPQDLLAANRQKGYVGLHIQQGVPLLDRDLNLLQDLITATVRSVISRYIGNGAAAGADGFAIQPLAAPQNVQSFNISAGTAPPGTALVGGIEVSIPADVTYQAQSSVALTTPTAAQPNPRPDFVYLDVSLIEIDGTTDADLNNTQDIGIETSARLKPVWVVQVAENVPIPAAPPGHVYYPLAQLMRPLNVATIDSTMITDLRQQRLTASNMEQRLSLIEKLVVRPAFTTQANQTPFIPRSGQIRQLITLNGVNFEVGTLEVSFGGATANIVGAPSSTAVTVQVPPGLTPAAIPVGVPITLTNEAGSSVSAGKFTVDAAPAFTDPGTQFSSANGLPGTPVVLNGFNFNAPGLQVLFGSVVATQTGTPTANQIVVPVPVGIVAGGGASATVPITVKTSQGSIVSDDIFTAQVGAPTPAFAAPNSQFSPNKGVGNQLITLFGQNFNFPPVSVIFVNTVTKQGLGDATINGAPSATQIAVQVPPGMVAAGGSLQVNITVTTAGGPVTSTDIFTVTGP